MTLHLLSLTHWIAPPPSGILVPHFSFLLETPHQPCAHSLDRQFLDNVDNDGAFTLTDFNRLQTRLVLPGEPPPDRLYGNKVRDDLKHLIGPRLFCIQIVFTVPARTM